MMIAAAPSAQDHPHNTAAPAAVSARRSSIRGVMLGIDRL
jgi:hypothetical protein